MCVSDHQINIQINQRARRANNFMLFCALNRVKGMVITMNYNFEEKLKQTIASCKQEIDIRKINIDTDLIKDFGFDSVDIVQLVVEIESAFDIEIDDEDLSPENLTSYINLTSIISKNIGM